MTLLPIVLALAAAMHHGPVPPEIARAVAGGCELEAARHPVDARACAALALVYAWHESGWDERPRPVSWDSRAGQSCGLLQLPCRWGDRSARWQVQAWLALLRRGTLAGLSGGGSAGERIARARVREADLLVEAVRERLEP